MSDIMQKSTQSSREDLSSPTRRAAHMLRQQQISLCGPAQKKSQDAALPDMFIRHSTEKDLDRIMEIYAYARRFMAEHGNPTQWGPTGWPPKALILSDIAAGNSYVCLCDTQIVGTFFFDYGPEIEPAYHKIENGSWLNSDPYGVIHRIAGSGSVKGVGRFCTEWAFARCGHLRMDTHGDNYVMQNLLVKNGFVHCGTIYVEEDTNPRLAYEKI